MQLESVSPRTIAIVSDAYHPQVNGVVSVLDATKQELEKRGHTVVVLSPRDFSRTVPLPTYAEIRVPVLPYRALARKLGALQPDAIHIVTVEGTLGMAARRYCKRHGFSFTSSYHTRLPEYLSVRTKIPASWIYPMVRRLHGAATYTMVTNSNIQSELRQAGFSNLVLWPRGVDTDMFRPDDPMPLSEARPIFMYMGRVAPEKNIEAFLSCQLPGTKYVVGDGPDRQRLEESYPEVVFTGYKFGRELARFLAAADAFVFPSTTDTYGMTMLEANACGTPIAGLPSQATETVVREGCNGAIAENLSEACMRALDIPRQTVRESIADSSWEKPTEAFLSHLVECQSHPRQ